MEDYPMYNENFEQWYKLNKNLGAPISDFTKALTIIGKRVSEQNIELLEENTTRLSDQFKRLSNVKKPEDFFELQKDCFNENMSAGVETLQKLMQTSMENLEEISKLWSTAATKISDTAIEKAHKYTEKMER
jgi:hypothetical protein